MTLFILMVFGSLIYTSQCMPVDMIPPVPEVNMPNYQEHIEGFMKDMSVAAEHHLQPLLAEMDPSDQQRAVEYGINSFVNYIDYMLQIINANEDVKILEESDGKTADLDDDYLDYDEDFANEPVKEKAWSQ